MIDNFKLIEEVLNFDSEDDFYHAVVLQRKKENPQIGSNSYVVKTYYIRSIKDLDFNKGEMIFLANYHNARVCINLNRRSFEKVAFQTLRKITDIIMNKDYKSVRKSYNSVCGLHSNEPVKRWIIDIDNKDYEEPFVGIKMIKFKSFLQSLDPIGDKVVLELPTKNGLHLITTPFNMKQYSDKYNMDIQKDNPTVLYIP